RNEVIAGRAAAREFQGLEIGNTLELGRLRWEVVGIFEADGGLEESEVWGDAAVIQPAYRRGNSYQIVQARLASPGTFQEFKDVLTSDPRLPVRVVRETEYYAEQSRLLVRLVTGLGTLIAALMGLGAVFGALNTMYTAVASRTREIATLRALGFPGLPVVISVLVESLVLAALGGTVGALVAWAAFDGYRAATLNWQSFSQVAFAFRVGPELLVQGLVYALVLGLVGGLFPALRAVRIPVGRALREG
ncbi:MAG: ABC transporter permease, partial [Thermoanaerobaculia bacterium]|nr:ABC transporter permease [Thermoanaerobaculia bacterium]